MSKLLVIVAGPTASGKTKLAIDIATHFQSVIVSFDSRQFYKELNIGTAKPNSFELKQVPHYFINSHSIYDNFNAGLFAEEATLLLKDLFTKHRVIVMVGGSGLYLDALIYGIDNLPQKDDELRLELQAILKNEGLEKLQQMLKEKDPESFKSIDTLNPRRIIRALEVSVISGQPYSTLLSKKNKQLPWEWLLTGINWPREILYQRINERTSQMITEGLESEAKNVIEFRNKNALKTVGYKEMFEHLDGNLSLAETELLIAKNTRNYAKRQLTWFRKYQEMVWINPNEINKLINRIDQLISNKK